MNTNKKLLKLFNRCLNAKYIHTENSGDYAIERDGSTVYLLFQCSSGQEDWKNNFDFAAKPYKDMKTPWKCHRGFLRVWKSIEPHIEDVVKDMSVNHFVIVGYSHGAAIATLCHEYVWFNRPDLRPEVCGAYLNIEGYGFGCPRVFFGWSIPRALRRRWISFFPIRNLNDIVTHLPPILFGYRHISLPIEIGEKGKLHKHRKLDCVNAHYPDNYILSLGGEEGED